MECIAKMRVTHKKKSRQNITPLFSYLCCFVFFTLDVEEVQLPLVCAHVCYSFERLCTCVFPQFAEREIQTPHKQCQNTRLSVFGSYMMSCCAATKKIQDSRDEIVVKINTTCSRKNTNKDIVLSCNVPHKERKTEKQTTKRQKHLPNIHLEKSDTENKHA